MDFTTQYQYGKTFMPTFLSRFPNLHTLRIHSLATDRIFLINDMFDLKLLRLESNHPVSKALQSLVLDNLVAVMPQASAFLIELSSIPRQQRDHGLVPFVPDFRNCIGFTDSLLQMRLGDLRSERAPKLSSSRMIYF